MWNVEEGKWVGRVKLLEHVCLLCDFLLSTWNVEIIISDSSKYFDEKCHLRNIPIACTRDWINHIFVHLALLIFFDLLFRMIVHGNLNIHSPSFLSFRCDGRSLWNTTFEFPLSTITMRCSNGFILNEHHAMVRLFFGRSSFVIFFCSESWNNSSTSIAAHRLDCKKVSDRTIQYDSAREEYWQGLLQYLTWLLVNYFRLLHFGCTLLGIAITRR